MVDTNFEVNQIVFFLKNKIKNLLEHRVSSKCFSLSKENELNEQISVLLEDDYFDLQSSICKDITYQLEIYYSIQNKKHLLERWVFTIKNRSNESNQ